MFSATSLLLLACACAVTINAQTVDKCISAQIGVLNNAPGQYAQAQVPGQVTDVYLENHPNCNNEEVGVFAWVCDNDVPPSAYFKDFNNLIVTRNGAGVGSATVDATAYCKGLKVNADLAAPQSPLSNSLYEVQCNLARVGTRTTVAAVPEAAELPKPQLMTSSTPPDRERVLMSQLMFCGARRVAIGTIAVTAARTRVRGH